MLSNNGKLGLTGQINVPHGQFKAYGQDLIVRRGEFMFAGSADNPLINLEAIRNPDKTADDVIAGIRVSRQAEDAGSDRSLPNPKKVRQNPSAT